MNNSSANKVIVAPFVDSPVTVADFDTDVWDRCESSTIAHYWSGQPAPPERHATAQVCWTTKCLIVRFVCEQHEPLVVAPDPVVHRKTLGLWDRDVCEIFLAPDPGNPARYFEFEAAPTGEWIDLGILITPNGRKTDWDFASGISTAARIERHRVFIGMTIPWSESIPLPDVGTEWRANLYRCVGSDPAERYLAWLPTYSVEPNFHVPEAFGRLRFE